MIHTTNDIEFKEINDDPLAKLPGFQRDFGTDAIEMKEYKDNSTVFRWLNIFFRIFVRNLPFMKEKLK